METLVICRPSPGTTPAQIARHATEELEVLRALHEEGLLRAAYTPGHPGAVLLFDGDEAAVGKALERLPLLREGLIEVERITMQPLPLARG